MLHRENRFLICLDDENKLPLNRKAIEWFSLKYEKVIGFELNAADWLKKFGPLFNPIRSKTKKLARNRFFCALGGSYMKLF